MTDRDMPLRIVFVRFPALAWLVELPDWDGGELYCHLWVGRAWGVWLVETVPRRPRRLLCLISPPRSDSWWWGRRVVVRRRRSGTTPMRTQPLVCSRSWMRWRALWSTISVIAAVRYEAQTRSSIVERSWTSSSTRPMHWLTLQMWGCEECVSVVVPVRCAETEVRDVKAETEAVWNHRSYYYCMCVTGSRA